MIKFAFEASLVSIPETKIGTTYPLDNSRPKCLGFHKIESGGPVMVDSFVGDTWKEEQRKAKQNIH